MTESKAQPEQQPPDPDKTVITDLNDQKPNAGRTLFTQSDGRNQNNIQTEVPGSETKATDFAQAARSPATEDFRNQQWGDFRIGELLGKGGMGSVYRGRQISLDRPVAIKVLPAHLSENENFRQRFALEAKAVARISSPHVIQVYAAGVEHGHHYFAMEFVEGTDLGRQLQKGYKPNAGEALDLVTQAARGLAAADEHGIVHRDIKPANMMVTPKGLLKLMDFGLVKLAANDTRNGLTMAGTIMGTVNYFSPEQGRGESCDTRTDIYALGIVFYELLTGRLPFSGPDPTSVIYQHIHQQPRAPKEINPTIPEDYQAVVLKCMQKKAEDRYQTPLDLLKDLECLGRGSTPVTAYIHPGSIRKGGDLVKSDLFTVERRRRRMGIVIGILAFAVAGVGTHWYVKHRKKAEDIPASVSPVPAPVKPSDGLSLEQISERTDKLVADDKFDEADSMLEPYLRDRGDDKKWLAVRDRLRRARGLAQLKVAKDALAHGENERAGKAVNNARGLLGDSPEIAALNDELGKREGASKQRSRMLAEANSLLDEGKAEQAEALLSGIAAGDSEVDAVLRRARKMREDAQALQKTIADLLDKADQAMARHDYDTAQSMFTTVRSLDNKSMRAAEGLDRVTRAKEAIEAARRKFQQALADKDLGAAEKHLAELRTLAPDSTVVTLSESELSRSKLVEEQQRQQKAELDAKMSDQAKAVSAIIADPKQDVPSMERALAAFLKQNGENRPERALLEAGIEKRKQQLQVGEQLAELDAAMQHKDAKAIAAVVADQEFAKALVELMDFPGLVFQQRIDLFDIKGDSATATVSLRHALTMFPERTLTYRYQLSRGSGRWRITEAKLQE